MFASSERDSAAVDPELRVQDPPIMRNSGLVIKLVTFFGIWRLVRSSPGQPRLPDSAGARSDFDNYPRAGFVEIVRPQDAVAVMDLYSIHGN